MGDDWGNWDADDNQSAAPASAPSNNVYSQPAPMDPVPSMSFGRGRRGRARDGPQNGSRAGGGGSDRACFRCGEQGHMSRDCPSSNTFGGGGGGGGSDRACFKCGEQGHMSRDCPSSNTFGGGGGSDRACFKCGEQGHMSRDCPNNNSRGGDRACYNCGEQGHMSRDCPNPRGGSDRSSRVGEGDGIRIEVNEGDIGRIIGKGGSKIKELERESGARIQVPRNEHPPVVVISGAPELCVRARTLIDELLAEGERRRMESDNRRRGFGGGGPRRNGANDFGNWRNFPERNFDDDDAEDDEGELVHLEDGSEERRFKDGTVIHTALNGQKTIQCYAKGPSDDVAPEPEETGEVMDCFARLRAAALSDELPPEWQNEAPLVKNFYEEDPAVTAMTEDERLEFLAAQNNIEVSELKKSDLAIPKPVRTFEEAWRRFPDILTEIKKQGFERPSPIQCQAWPTLLQGRDFIGIAQTGSGKTLAFLLPAFIHIEGQAKPRSERVGPTVLILAPTRELALQIQSEVDKYSYRGIRCLCVYGGASRREQINAIELAPLEIVVATPGRLNDLVNAEKLSLHDVSYVVLDEADRMLDMGFEPQVVKTLYATRKDRQTVMTSATWPFGVRRIANDYMRNPVQCVVGTLDLNACHDVVQKVEFVSREEKKTQLFQFIEEMGENDKAIIFVGRKLDVDDLTSDMAIKGYAAEAIHGGREQSDREGALVDFREGSTRLLVATDLASRGLDIVDITHVINYDFPRNIEEYVHRVGRTGRAGRTGTSITFMSREDWRHAKELIAILEEASQEVPEELRGMAERFARRQADGPRRGGGGFRGGGRGGRGWREY